MSKLVGHRRTVGDHFEPDEADDPKAQRQLRGQLEQIDYAAYDANRKVLGATLGDVGIHKFQQLGLAAAQCRARWVAAALAATEGAKVPTPEQVEKLIRLRSAYEELTAVYDAMRRMVERGYVSHPTA
jgi:long-subunit acyl-CoA synthetase (AMP-forming)